MYGPDDQASKFTSQIIKSCLANEPEIKLTLGNQKRDFVYIDDVVAAYEILLENTDLQEELYYEYHIGSGKAITIREFVETVHQLSHSSSHLDFGALPYRKNEIMNSETSIEQMMLLGWRCQTKLADGIMKIIRYEKEFQK